MLEADGDFTDTLSCKPVLHHRHIIMQTGPPQETPQIHYHANRSSTVDSTDTLSCKPVLHRRLHRHIIMQTGPPQETPQTHYHANRSSTIDTLSCKPVLYDRNSRLISRVQLRYMFSPK
ncbi:hypothetical protein DPMN_102418 [Dreissena polymorpha]|uniref:Uncharacterized protein n=1 Tax=Dreissena polymorpha TaxID=45954 RepID=A0A9D4LMW1_DREPO|nr:hypothetical protein DPMN_102418 [Dreissena polymorpha]